MTRLFLTLYGVLVVTLALFVVGIETIPEWALKRTTQDYFHQITRGSFLLVEKELRDRPREQWSEVVEELQPHFGYPLNLISVVSGELDTADTRSLNTGKVVHREIDGAVILYKRLPETDLMISMALEQTDTEDGLRAASGTAHLLQKAFTSRPQAQWPQLVNELQPTFGFPIKLLPLNDAPVDEEQRRALEAGEMLAFDVQEEQERYLQRIDHSDWVFQAGPLGHPFIFVHLGWIVLVILALLVALAVFLWLRPVWRDLAQLDDKAAALGRGEFDARIHLKKRKALIPIATTFNQMAERVQRPINSHKELTNAVSHELRTPIARLRFGVDMLETATNETDRARYLESMQTDITELDELVAELLAYARFDRTQPHMEFTRARIQPWLPERLDHARLDMGDLELTSHCDPSVVNQAVAFDPCLLARAINNLLRNARRYANKTITIRIEISAGHCLLCVDDDGCGVPEEDRQRILEPFTRIDESRDRQSGGVGLGLAITRQVIGWHGGELLIGDSPLGGARFTLRWPIDGPGTLDRA